MSSVTGDFLKNCATFVLIVSIGLVAVAGCFNFADDEIEMWNPDRFKTNVEAAFKGRGKETNTQENIDYGLSDDPERFKDWDKPFNGDDNIWGRPIENSPYLDEWERITNDMSDVPTVNEIEELIYESPRWEEGPLFWHYAYDTRKAAIDDLEAFDVEYRVENDTLYVDTPGVYLFRPGERNRDEYVIGSYEGKEARENYGGSIGYIGFRNALIMCQHLENHGIEQTGIAGIDLSKGFVPQAYVVVPVKSGIAFVLPNHNVNYDRTGNYVLVNWKLGDNEPIMMNQEHTGFDDFQVENIWINWRNGYGDYGEKITYG